MAVKGAQEVYAQARVSPDEVDVVELHDCFSTNELITYEALVYKILLYSVHVVESCFRSGILYSMINTNLKSPCSTCYREFYFLVLIKLYLSL